MSADAPLAGRAAIVTGAGRGVGEGIARALAAHGARVVIADNGAEIDGSGGDESIARAVAADIGQQAVAYTKDIASPEAAAEMVALAVDTFGGIDIVINNAAILRDAFVFKGTPADWDAVIKTNLSAGYYLTRAATPVMRDQAKAERGANDGIPHYHWGRIVNIVSTVGFYGNFGQAPYGSAKGGLMSLTRVTALDMARSHVTCNALAPFAFSRVTASIKPANDDQARYIETAKTVKHHHVGNFIAYLCSPGAQDISGQLFAVRGREAFLLSQPRPVARIVADGKDWDIESLGPAVDAGFKPHFAELTTDIETFGATDPIV